MYQTDTASISTVFRAHCMFPEDITLYALQISGQSNEILTLPPPPLQNKDIFRALPKVD